MVDCQNNFFNIKFNNIKGKFMKLSDLITQHTKSMALQGKLLKRITLDDGTVYKKGTVSEILIDKGNDTYHFEANNSACTVKADEIEILSNSPKNNKKIKI